MERRTFVPRCAAVAKADRGIRLPRKRCGFPASVRYGGRWLCWRHDPARLMFLSMPDPGWRVGEVFLHRWWRDFADQPAECVVTAVQRTEYGRRRAWMVYWVEAPYGRHDRAQPGNVPSIVKVSDFPARTLEEAGGVPEEEQRA